MFSIIRALHLDPSPRALTPLRILHFPNSLLSSPYESHVVLSPAWHAISFAFPPLPSSRRSLLTGTTGFRCFFFSLGGLSSPPPPFPLCPGHFFSPPPGFFRDPASRPGPDRSFIPSQNRVVNPFRSQFSQHLIISSGRLAWLLPLHASLSSY